MTDTNTTETVKLTAEQKLIQKLNKLAERINTDTLAYNEAKAELDSLQALANVAAGDKVSFTVKKDAFEGVVLGVKEDEAGKQYKVITGEGVDTQVFTLKAAQITGVIVEQAEPVADAAE